MSFLGTILGSGAIKEAAEVFTVNRENADARASELEAATISQYAAEFHSRQNRGLIDRMADGLNRLVRPVLTIIIFAPLPATYFSPETMADVWDSFATIPREYWALLAVVIGFYFGGRMQLKALGSRSTFEVAAQAARNLAKSRKPVVVEKAVVAVEEIPTVEAVKPSVASGPPIDFTSVPKTQNRAVMDWIATMQTRAGVT